jgi:hypothetical protein
METKKNKCLKGYRAVVGKSENSGFVNYLPDRTMAIKWCKQIKKAVKNSKVETEFFIKEVALKECDINWCKNLIPVDQEVCDKCDSLIYDAMVDQQEHDKFEGYEDKLYEGK